MDRRTPMIAGITFGVLFAVALVMVPAMPGIGQPGYDIVSHVNEHAAAMRAHALLVAFGSLALVVVLGHARDRLSGPAGYVFTSARRWCWFSCSSRRGSPRGSRCTLLSSVRRPRARSVTSWRCRRR